MRKLAYTYGILIKYPPKVYKMHDFHFPRGLEVRQIGAYIILFIACYLFRNIEFLIWIRSLPLAVWVSAWFLAPWYLGGIVLKIKFEDKKIYLYLLGRLRFLFQKKEYVRFRAIETRGKKIFRYDGVKK